MPYSSIDQQTSARKRAGRIVKLVVSMICFAGDALWRLVLKLAGRNPSPSYVVLYYHDVPSSQRQRFARQMDMVLSLTTPVSTEDGRTFVAGEHYSAITFDDGFDSCLDNAVPELTARNIPATFFVAVGFLNRNADWWPSSDRQSRERIAAEDRWRQLPAALFTIGSHTVAHPDLTAVSEQEAKVELNDSRIALTQLLNREIEAFSFPYGGFTPRLLELCLEAGYKQAFTTLPENSAHRISGIKIGRTPAEPDDWPIEFRLKLLGAYRWLPFAISCKRRIVKAVVRKSAHADAPLSVEKMMHERNR